MSKFSDKCPKEDCHRMYPMTNTGIVECMKALKDKKLKYQTSKERQ